MKRTTIIALAAIGLTLAACTPTTTITPVQAQEQISRLDFPTAFQKVITAINSQPYPSTSGGWVITSSDQIGGFVAAELNGYTLSWLGGQMPFRAYLSVALVARDDGTTAVNISTNSQEEAVKLAENIRGGLDLR